MGVCNEELKKKDLNTQIQEAFKLQQDNQEALRQTQGELNTLIQELASELEMEDWEEKDNMANKKRKLKDKIKKLKEECKDWKDKAGKVSELEGKLKKAEAEVGRLEGELDEHEKTIGTAKTNYDELDRQKRQAEGDRDAWKEKKENLDAAYKNLEKEKNALQTQLTNKEKELRDKDQEVADAQKQAQAYKDFEPLKELFEIAKQGSIPSLVVRHLEEFLYEIYKDLDFTLDALAQDIADQYSKNKGDLDNPQLQKFFDTLFGLVGEKMGLERLRVQEGESYNSGLCRKLDQSMPTQGKITQVHFQGYKQKGKVKHASSVSVK
ncbi:nonmuscle myosin heavy chain [Helicobacter bizzozeronii CIII-1]|uniref:Nonmuscle myosin heavy chain n=1 Tax=Helicobacter bizzozeronii (strain CIII-1) TaxID=1002804 RepID=F8KTL1_HELBC|nr:nonmuscle myosin heavy chain [Helicobacter bizzozeronii CIII-1]